MTGLSKYQIMCELVEQKNFTKVAEKIGYTQSAVSQMIKSLEADLGVTLIDRKRGGISLTKDGLSFMPYIEAIAMAEDSLERKRKELVNLENSKIIIGAFASVSRRILPECMAIFKKQYPDTEIIVKQGDHTSVPQWVENGAVDFGFTSMYAKGDLNGKELYRDHLMAVLPKGHPLEKEDEVSLGQLAKENFILTDEGEYNVSYLSFQDEGIEVHPTYVIYDEYAIIEMVQRGLGVSMIYESILENGPKDIVVKPIKEKPHRTIDLIWKNEDTMSYASKQFAKVVVKQQL